MKRNNWRIGLAYGTALALAAGCKPTPPEPQVGAETSKAEVKQEVAEAFDATSEYVGGKTEDFNVWVKRELGDLRLQMDGLHERGAETGDDAKRNTSEALESMHRRLDAMDAKLESLAASTGDAMEDTRREIRSELDALRESFKGLRRDDT